MKVRLTAATQEWMPGGAFHRDFVYQFPRVAPFFAYDHRSIGSTIRRRKHLAGWRGDRRRLSELLLRDNTRWGADPDALESAVELRRENVYVVSAQVRPSVLGGSGSVLLKVLSLLEYARRLASAAGTRVIPVLWVVSDHNWGIIGRVPCADVDGRIRSLALKPDPPGCPSAGEIPVHPGIDRLLGEFEAAVGADAGDSEVVKLIRRVSRESETVAECFCRLMCELFSGRGLLLVDGSSPGLRELVAPILQRAAVRRRRVDGELAVGAERLSAKGYSVPFPAGAGRSHIFADSGRGRVQLFLEDGRLRDASGNVDIDAAALAQLIADEPHRFSPGEALRPAVQDLVLPVLAHIVGGEEASCRAQGKGIHSLFEGAMPPLFPQMSLTFIEPGVAAEMARRDIPVDALVRDSQFDQLLGSALAALGEEHIETVLREAWDRIDRAHGRMRSALEEQVPSLKRVGEVNAVRIRRQIEYYDRKARQHHRRRHREVVRGYRLVRNRLRPPGKTQEDLSYLPLMVRRGTGWMGDLLEVASAEEKLWGHFFVEWAE
ncbi:MAG: bacillithiol biosynthesis BshC [Bacillota bacterium]